MFSYARPLNWVQWVSLLTAVAVSVLLPLIVIQINSEAAARAHTAAAEQAAQTRTLRTLVCFFEAKSLANPRLPAQQKQQTVAVFSAALRRIHAKPC